MINQETLNEFEKIYNETYSDIARYVVCNCSNINDTLDIIQNIYLDVLKNIDKINLYQHKPYIMGIAKNKIKDYYRYHYKHKIVSLFSSKEDLNVLENIPNDINIEESFTLKYDIELVWKYLKKKPVIIAKIFYLYYYLELTIKEISCELGITESNVKNYLYRTLKELNKYLEKECDKDV